MTEEFIVCDPDEISFTVAEDGKSISFQPCGWTSFLQKDVAERYCPRCHRFMDLVMLARQMKGEAFP